MEAIEVAKKTGIKQIFMKISEKDIKEQTNLEMVFIRQRRQWMDRLHEITRLCPNLKEIYTTHIHDRHPVHQAVSVIVSGWYFHECKIDGVKLFFYSIFPIDDWIAYQICELNEEGICKTDCKWCGDNSCNGNEDYKACPQDCERPVICGDSICDINENCCIDCGCDAGYECISNSCVLAYKCISNSDCKDNEACIDNKCVLIAQSPKK